MECKGISSMFAYGTTKWGDSRCNGDGCRCICETAAARSGTCDTTDNTGYDLFKLVPSFQLVRGKAECSGDEDTKGYLKTIEDCAIQCKGVSSMFLYGTTKWGDSRCNKDGCMCICETAAASSGTCSATENKGYDLFKFTG